MATNTTTAVSLKPGDRLTRDEFHRRYCARPDIKKAELIDGVVYVPSPLRARQHGQPHGLVMLWLGTYCVRHPELLLEDNSTVFLDGNTEVQPDASVWREEPGGPRLTEDDYIEGAPQLVVEVAASSASYDLREKMEAYRRNGVREYIVWRVLDRTIDWFRLRDGVYVRIDPDAEDVIESEQYPGLRLHIPSMLAGDRPNVLGWLR
jgi:Uma2 family endonuclease